jgi:hypothetical protein
MKQEDRKFKTNLGCTGEPVSKNKNKGQSFWGKRGRRNNTQTFCKRHIQKKRNLTRHGYSHLQSQHFGRKT